MRASILLCGAVVMLAACEQMPGLQRAPAGEAADARVSLALEVPDALDWGEVATVRMTVANEGDAAARALRVELYLPGWLEFSAVEPVGTEVALLSTGDETRLAYSLADPPLAPGDARTIVQRVRVPPRTAGPGRAGDTVRIEPSLVPQNRTLRARLVDAGGRLLGSELRTTLPFRGVGPAAPATTTTPPPAGAVPADTLPRPQTRPQVPPAQPPRDTAPARDTTPRR